ncbi:MAG: TraR/DksA family transcriptional regulator [Deltaproteobacteria bacterium]|nr:TraR/DksA family transcriptional regulator [Deltaproteobacteria bacterium]
MTESVAELNRHEKLRAILAERKATLLAELRKSMEEQRTENSSMSFELAQDDGDKSVEDHERHVQASVQSIKSEELDIIDLALEKLAAGTYGICQECGCEIPLKRLEIQPCAAYCINCQEDIDQLNKRDRLGVQDNQSRLDTTYDYLPDE